MTQLHAQDHAPAGSWNAADQIDSIALDFDRRYRRRLALVTDAGRDLLLDLPRPHRLQDGDGLLLTEGGIVRVVAAAEPVMDIHAPQAGLVRIAWHLGNRHLAVQLLPAALRIRADHVIAEMAELLGGHVHSLAAAFEPEGGAYAAGAPHQHAPHQHAHDHDHG